MIQNQLFQDFFHPIAGLIDEDVVERVNEEIDSIIDSPSQEKIQRLRRDVLQAVPIRTDSIEQLAHMITCQPSGEQALPPTKAHLVLDKLAKFLLLNESQKVSKDEIECWKYLNLLVEKASCKRIGNFSTIDFINMYIFYKSCHRF